MSIIVDQKAKCHNKSAESLPVFAQIDPAHTCRNAIYNIMQSLYVGYEVRCRDPRCSFGCHSNWAWKHWLCVHRLVWDHIDENLIIYRGHLRMPENATPAQHLKTRQEFLRIMNRWRSRNNYVLEMHAVMDIDDYLNAHYDTMAYSDAPKRPLKTALSKAWSKAGGLKQSLVTVDDDELIGAMKYQSKDTTRPDRTVKYLPATRKQMGMNHIFSTKTRKGSKGFWQGMSETIMWEEWKSEWDKQRKLESERRPIVDMETTTKLRSKMVAHLRRICPDSEQMLKTFDWYSLRDYPTENEKQSACKSDVI